MREAKGKGLEIRPIRTMMNHATTEVFFTDMRVPAENLIGEEGKGFRYILSGMNAERILIASESVGDAKWFIAKASAYAKERIVFGRPIGKNQAIQHPLARHWMELEAANLMVFKAAALYDAGKPCGAESNAAKYLGAEAALACCQTAVTTHGGMGYAREFHVERYLREAMIARLAPVSAEMILNFIGEKVLGLPRSY
jgi:alkylation response protein AidB-like acyl-CoA dehydrogenase